MVELDQSRLPSRRVTQGVLDDRQVTRLSQILKALAHPVRLRMIDLIHQGGGDVCVCEFEKHFDLKQPTISHHLKILRDAGVIRSRQDGTWVRHTIVGDILSMAQQSLGAFVADHEPA